MLAEAIERLRGVRISAADWSLDDLPAHLRMTFCVEDEDGAVLASGRSLDALRDELRPALKARLEHAVPALARHGMRGFDVDPLPRTVDLPRRLLQLTVPSPRRWVTDQLGTQLTLALTAAPHDTLEAVIEDATNAALDALIASGGGPA